MKMAAEISSEKSDVEIIIPTTLELEDEKESSRRYKETRKPGKVCCQIFLFLMFVLLFVSTVYFSYKSFEYKHKLNKCTAANEKILASKPRELLDFMKKPHKHNKDKQHNADGPHAMPKPSFKTEKTSADDEVEAALGNTLEPGRDEEQSMVDEEEEIIGNKTAGDPMSRWQRIVNNLQKCIVIKPFEHGGTEANIDAMCLRKAVGSKIRALSKFNPRKIGNLIPFPPLHSN